MDSDRPTDELLQRMLSAVVNTMGAEGAVDRLVGAARAEAEAEVKELLKAAIKATLLQRAVSRLESGLDGASTAGDDIVPGLAEPEPAAREVARTRTRESSAPTLASACYVYGMVRAPLEAALPPNVPGVDPRAPLRFVREGAVAALVTDISLAEFGADAIAERVKDLGWVEEKVRAHDRVIKEMLTTGAVVPCRFGMVLRDEQDVRSVLAAHEQDVLAALDTVEAKKEWGVKVLAAAPGRASQRDAATPESGRAYFLQKKRDELARAEASRAVREAADACHRELAAAADDAALLPGGNRSIGQGGAEGGDAADVVLNAAYLVADADTGAFHAKVDSLAERYRAFGMTVEVSGPWPPYNFVSLDLSLQPDDPPGPREPARPEAAA